MRRPSFNDILVPACDLPISPVQLSVLRCLQLQRLRWMASIEAALTLVPSFRGDGGVRDTFG